MTADTMYKILLYATGKNKQNGYISPDDFNLIINQGQQSYTDYLLGEYEQYQPRRPIPIVGLGQSERIRQSLTPLIYDVIIPISTIPGSNPTCGTSNYPGDFLATDSVWTQYGFTSIKFVQQDRLSSYVQSVIDPIATNPIYTVNASGFNFYPPNPNNANNARLSYIRTPPSIVWGYVLDGNQRPVYNAATSQHPVWGDTDCLQIIVRTLSIIGVNLQTPIVMQYANEIKYKGQ